MGGEAEGPGTGREACPTEAESFGAEKDFAVGDDLFVDREAVFVGAGREAGAESAAHETDSGRGLEDIGRKRRALGIELDFDVAGVGKPDDLLAGIEREHFGENSDEDKFFRHAN